MTLDQIIALFKDMESGKEGQLIGFHLHKGIKQAMELDWFTNHRRDSKFSDFLEALREEQGGGYWRSPTGENHGMNSRPGDTWVSV